MQNQSQDKFGPSKPARGRFAPEPTAREERALLAQAVLGRRDRAEAEDSLLELERLTDTAGARVVGVLTQCRARATPRLLIGEGKLADVEQACRQADANLIVFDNDLTSMQVNNLDQALGIKVIDRTELILQIFARRARSTEAQVQVELAQLEYLVKRLPTSRRQQRFQGGIGMRGPGESPLQLRNEPMRRRIKELKRKLVHIRKQQEQARGRRPWPVVCLVGYTNAGKSTMLNTFTHAGTYVDDRLFATLDTTTRLVHLPGDRGILMTDTVGFIRHLPHGLVASFRSTLDVAREADLLLIVADAGHPRTNDHLQVARETLGEIGARDVPALLVFNKIDAVDRARRTELRAAYSEAILVSAHSEEGLEALKEAIVTTLRAHEIPLPPYPRITPPIGDHACCTS